MAKLLLAGDIGATNARLALFEGGAAAPRALHVYASAAHASLEEVTDEFLRRHARGHTLAAAAFGVAGPVRDGRAEVTNLPWVVSRRALERRLSVPRVEIVNDLVAAAVGCLHAAPESMVPLTETLPAPTGRNAAVISAGSGLGEAMLVWDGGRHVPVPTEAGHADFAPRTPLEVEVWHYLAGLYPEHVSAERALSGPGIGALYDFFASRTGREPPAVTRRLQSGDRNVAVVQLGLAREHRPAALAVDAFAALYGAEAGNLALRALALGGVYVTGSIGRTVVPARREQFLGAFLRKGRMRELLASIPVAVVTDTQVALRGALALAREISQSERTRPRRRATR